MSGPAGRSKLRDYFDRRKSDVPQSGSFYFAGGGAEDEVGMPLQK